MIKLFAQKQKSNNVTISEAISSWKNELADKIISLTEGISLNNFKTAVSIINLINSNIPNNLYRYRPLSSETDYNRLIEFFDTAELYCAKHSGLNDPLDLRSPITDVGLSFYDEQDMNASKMVCIMFTIALLLEATKENGEKDAMSQISDIFVHMGMAEKDIKNTIKKLIDICNAKKEVELEDTNYEAIHKILANNSSFNKILTEIYLAKPHTTIHETLDEVGVACFTESSQNMPMWWHYATERKGVCLEFQAKVCIPKRHNVWLLPVRYINILPDITSNVLLNTGKMSLYHALLHVCMHKHCDWSYEKEWRIINFKSLSNDKNDKPNSIEFALPTKIILGDKIDSIYKDGISQKATEKRILVTQMEITNIGYSENTVYNPKTCKR